MIFHVNSIEDKLVEKVYNKGMKKFNEFFKSNIPKGALKIFIVDTRKEIDLLRNEKTEDWVVGWSKHGEVFLLNPKNYEKESNHKYSEKNYSALILHEMVHFFHGNLIDRGEGHPYWLNEGLAIFLSGQNGLKKRPLKLTKFLSSYSNYSSGIYQESGFFIESLFVDFGKSKLIKLLKEAAKCDTRKEFYKQFKQIYGFELNYNEINKRYKK